MRNRNENRRRAVILMLAVAGLLTCAAPSVTSSGLANARATAPSWSATLRANGKIAFTSYRDGNPEIYVMNPDGSNQTRLTNNSIVDDHAMWSPDGTKLAFVSQREGGGFAIFQMNMDGTNRVEITPLSDFVNGPPFGAIGFSMSWSPDGRKIAFQDPYYNDIWVVALETGVRQNLTNDGGTNFGQLDFHPAWSPDGTTILYSSPRFNGAAPSLHAINPDGTTNRRLAVEYLNGPAYSPSWSPDGTQIVFVELNGEFVESELHIANSDGTEVRVFDGGYPDTSNRDYPRWSPDGRQIAFNMADANFRDIEIYVKNIDGTGLTQLTDTPAELGLNYRPSWQPLALAACPNPIDCADFFVRQHYRDFLNREPDDAGLAFWTDEITSCGTDAGCVEARRINVSAAFFLSIEFQESGYLTYRAHKAAFGNLPGKPVPLTLQDFLAGAQHLAVVVGTPGWEQQLEAQKVSFFDEFVTRSQFAAAYGGLTNEQYVDALNANTGGALSQTERGALVANLNASAKTRAQALRAVAEDADFAQAEQNRAFVLAQYFGYLRRNPDDAGFGGQPDPNFDGYHFWLQKLEQFGGNFVEAEMVRAFISSIEYRRRFAQQ